jgi:PAS domain S-box-containing protein
MKDKDLDQHQHQPVIKGFSMSPSVSSWDVKSLLLELGVHQEELKAQNEELRQAQLELSVARDRYKELFDSAPIGYLVLDGSLMIRETNLRAASLLGTPGQDLIGTPLSRFMGRQEADAYYLHLMEVRKRGTQQSCELVFCRSEGSLFHGYLETSPYESALFGNGWRIALVDITKRKQAEEELQEANMTLEQRVKERTMDLQRLTNQLEKSRDDLRKLASELVLAEERERKIIAVTLHDEVAQTLAAIRMKIDLLQRLPGDDECRQVIAQAQELLSHSIRQTRALMTDISNPVLYDMGLRSAVEELAERIKDHHGIQVKCLFEGHFGSLSQDLNVVIFQIVKELLQNVIKHSGARGANIRIIEVNHTIRTTVADDGAGFDVSVINSADYGKGGFGLFSIRERVKSFNGNIQITSRLGIGSEVTVVLPVMAASKPALRKSPKRIRR